MNCFIVVFCLFVLFPFTELNESKGPLLKPYPSWQSHEVVNANEVPDIISPFHLKIDKCHRLWTVDTGVVNVLATNKTKRLAPARILIYDLRTDNLIRDHELPTLKSEKTLFSNIAVEDGDCEDTFAYIADSSVPSSLIVYSFKSNDLWQVKHNFFNIDPMAGNFNISGIDYRTTIGLYGLALSEKKSNGFADLYFHALTSFSEFNVSTAVLRNKSIVEKAGEFYKDFKVIGSRKMNEQAGSSVYDRSNKVIFYTLPNQNSIACWRTTSKTYNISKGMVQGSGTDDSEYPIDVKIDDKERIWTLSNNFHRFINGKLDESKINFHIRFAPVKEAIKNTACEPGFIENVVNKFNKVLRSDGNGANIEKPAAIFTLIGTISLWAIHKISI